MKKLISVLMAIVIFSGLCVSVSAQENNDGYAYGSYEYGGELFFDSYIRIDNLNDVEKLVISISYNTDKLKSPVVDAPVYFNVEKEFAEGRITLTVTEGNGIFEEEYFFVNFVVLDENLQEDETGFTVSAKAEFRDGSVRELIIPVNVEIYLHLPILQPLWKEINITCDKQFFIIGEDVTFSIPVVHFPEAEKIKVVFMYNKEALALSKVIADESVSFVTEETEKGCQIIFDCDEQSDGGISVTFEVRAKKNPVFSVSAMMITENGENKGLYSNGYYPSSYVYEKSEIPEIVLSDRLELYLEGDTLYFPFTVTEKYFDGEISSTTGRYGADLAYRFAGACYTDRPVVNGETINANAGGTISDSIKICVLGDINCNGYVTAADARLALRHAAKIETVDGIKADAADVDRNGVINAADARMILRVGSKLDAFALPEKAVAKGEEFVISGLLNAGSGLYNWRCTVSDENAFVVSDTISPPEDVEINPGTPFEQTFTFKALKAGTYNVHFELIASHEKEPIDEFEFTVNVFNDITEVIIPL